MFKNKIIYNGHTKETTISDLLVVILSLLFSLSVPCAGGDYPACLIFFLLVIVVIVTKYLKINL